MRSNLARELLVYLALPLAAMFAVAAAPSCKVPPGVVNDVGQVTLCVEQGILAAVQSGQTTFEDIAISLAAECGNITATEVENIIALWLNGPAGDAGTVVSAVPQAGPLVGASPGLVAKFKALHHKAPATR